MFVFRLERVLKYRKKLEEEAQRDFSKKRRELMQIMHHIDEEREKLGNFVKDYSLKEGVFSAFELVAVDNYISRSHGMIQKLKDREKVKAGEVSAALGVLTESKKASKLLENLRKRRYQKYLDGELRAENSELDDINQKISVNREKLTIENVPVEDM
jgi:flagellar export protein FliJ